MTVAPASAGILLDLFGHGESVHLRHLRVEHDEGKGRVRPTLRSCMAATPAGPLSASTGFMSHRPSVASRICRLTALSSTTRTGMSRRCVNLRVPGALPRPPTVLKIERHREVERAALPGLALQPDASAQQRDEVRRNRETEAGASILACRRAVGLDERLEDRLLLLLRHADAGIRHAEPEDGVAVGLRLGLDGQHDLAVLGELDGVPDEIRDDLAQSAGVAHAGRSARRAGCHRPAPVPSRAPAWPAV